MRHRTPATIRRLSARAKPIIGSRGRWNASYASSPRSGRASPICGTRAALLSGSSGNRPGTAAEIATQAPTQETQAPTRRRDQRPRPPRARSIAPTRYDTLVSDYRTCPGEEPLAAGRSSRLAPAGASWLASPVARSTSSVSRSSRRRMTSNAIRMSLFNVSCGRSSDLVSKFEIRAAIRHSSYGGSLPYSASRLFR